MKNITSTPIKRGEFISFSSGSGVINGGAGGDILTLTPPSGQRVRVTHLSTTALAIQSGISILFGGIEVLTNLSIAGGVPNAVDGRYSIGSYFPYAAGVPPSGNHKYITGKTGENLVVNKVAGTTAQTIYYAYEFGE